MRAESFWLGPWSALLPKVEREREGGNEPHMSHKRAKTELQVS